MSIRRIDTTLSTIRNILDEKGNYLPAGNYYFSIKNYESGYFTGEIKNRGDFGNFTFSPRKLVKMMAVGQSRLAKKANLSNEEGMPNYPSPLERTNTTRISDFTANLNSPYVVRNFAVNRNVVVPPPVHCSICFENISESSKKALNCEHTFHTTCINTWLLENNTCPLCRAPQSINENRSSREDPFMEAVNNLRTETQNTSLYYTERNRDFVERRERRTVVFPGSRSSSRYMHSSRYLHK